MPAKPRGPGVPFTKNDPRRGKSPGRPKKSVTWKQAEEALREALPRMIMLTDKERAALVKAGATGAELLAMRYIDEETAETVDRFLGKTPKVLTGANGAPLIPKPVGALLPLMSFEGWTPAQIDRFIESTKPK